MKDALDIIKDIAGFCFLILGVITTIRLACWLYLWISYAFAYLSP